MKKAKKIKIPPDMIKSMQEMSKLQYTTQQLMDACPKFQLKIDEAAQKMPEGDAKKLFSNKEIRPFLISSILRAFGIKEIEIKK